MGVDLAKLSLWLTTLAKDHPFTFLDHALRCGDSLVGLTRRQIADFHWKSAPQRVFGQEVIEQRIQAATRLRPDIHEAGDEVPFLLKQQKLALADESLGLVRFAGNLAVAAFFAGANDRQRQAKRDDLLAQFTEYLRTGNLALRPPAAEKALRGGPKGISPFHWEIEFPEVFGRDNPGFDRIAGNPPFLGGARVSTERGMSYFVWLTEQFPPAGHLCDQVAYFFRRAFDLLRSAGTFGLIATNTIAQGDTREGGLTAVVHRGGRDLLLYSASEMAWPSSRRCIGGPHCKEPWSARM